MWTTMGSRTGRRAAALMAAAALLLLAGCSRKTDNFHSPSEPVVPLTASLGTITALPLQIAAAGGNSVIAVEVKDLDGDPLPGVQVSFAASLGAIVATATSDSLGVAGAAFTSGASSGFCADHRDGSRREA